MLALLPLKRLDAAKTRLSGVLSGAGRRDLMRAMAGDVLSVLAAHPAVTGICLVSADPGARELAGRFGARHLPEAELGCRGLNAVLQAACERLATAPGQALLLLHADLPWLSAADIDAALDLYRQRGAPLVLAPDRAGRGSNLMLFRADQAPVFQFGPNSCREHQAGAAAAGRPCVLLPRAGLARDVDTPADLADLRTMAGVGPATRAWLDSESRRLAVAGRGGDDADRGAGGAIERENNAVSNAVKLVEKIRRDWERGDSPADALALALADCDDTAALARQAATLRDRGHGEVVTYSRKLFLPLTHLCRDVCHYCTFARTPRRVERPYLPIDQVLEQCRQAQALGCQEALLTLGEKPELRYRSAREALAAMGYASTLDYVRAVAAAILAETDLLPHINAGCMTAGDFARLRPVSASMGIMLESASERLCQKGMPHYGSPDKQPGRRLETIALAGEAAVPFTSGILIGIGETRRERIESLLALRDLHQRHGHLQEVIVQNFRAKPGTRMAASPEPELDELLWTIAVARLVFGPDMNIQAPPNLSPGVLGQLVAAGINDWGGVSPLTPDFVNPEAPWPHLDRLAAETRAASKHLDQRLTVYPAYVRDPRRWLDPALHTPVLRQSDSAGFARRERWAPGEAAAVPAADRALVEEGVRATPSVALARIVDKCRAGETLSASEVALLFGARGADFAYVAGVADSLRRATCGDTVTYVVNRNINYTNVCYFKCQFCAFSKGSQHEALRGRPYDISGEEIARRCVEAWQRGATEVCMQGGIHPDYTGQTYLDILHTVRSATPDMHIHAFSPLEVSQGAATLGLDLADFLTRLKAAGLNTLPGTAAEVLHDEVRAVLCPDKLDSARWLEVMEAAHAVGLRSTATIMYGHVDQPVHWARHLLSIRELQQRTGGFTEFVPLPFVPMEAPLYLRGRARRGPTFREAVLMHAVARLVLHGLIDNIQVSWVKMGADGVAACLRAGANDLGGTLMNESITRAAGASHGQEWSPAQMEAEIRAAGRIPRQRTTLYGAVSDERRRAASAAGDLLAVDNQSAARRQRSKRPEQQWPAATPTQGAPAQGAAVAPAQVLPLAACN